MSDRKRNSPYRDMEVFVVSGVAVIAALLLSLFYIVDQGDRAIVLRFGEVKETSGPGFHWRIPFVDNVVKVSVRSSKVKGKYAVYSKDIQSAEIGLSVNYALNPAVVTDVYAKYGTNYEDRIIKPQIITKVKDAFGRKNAVETIQARDALAKMILDELQEYFHDTGFAFQSVQIENIDFSDEYERSVEERMKAEVEVAKVQQNLARERINADMIRTRAQGEADARLAEAEARAKSIALISAAEADAIKAKATALTENPAYIQYVHAERWNGALPTSMIPNGTLPVLNIDIGKTTTN